MPPLFSIIIPVYRSGPFLRDCLDSIRNQTLTDWECICINDGSPDDSGAILDEYARKDARFTAIHQDNRGVSAARNAGLSVARGNWTAFVDGDDTVEPDMLACLHEEALRAQEAALLCYGISKDFHAGSRLIRTETTLPSRNQHIPAGETGAFLRYLLTSLDMESSCNKLFRTELLKKNGILFNTSAVVFEDFQFVLDYLSACAPDIILLKKAFYHYRAQETENGAAKRSRFNLVRDIDALTTKFLAWASTLSLPQEDIPIVKGYILQKISVIFHALQRQPYAARREVFRDFLSSGLAARKAELPLCGRYFHLVCRLLAARTPSAGFMKSLLLKRICSSYEAGRSTAEKLLGRGSMEEDWAEGEDDEEEMRESFLSNLSPAEEACLKTVSRLLEQESARDKKLETIRWFLTEFRTDGKNWLEHGCIIFSQYYDTAAHVAGWLAAELGDEPVALYAGVGRSRLFLGHSSAAEEREPIKRAVKNREIRVVVATDAACEGLNLQTLGTLINCDLPWNPSRMEQRLGRIKRFGQSRECVDMLNLVYRGTLDERIYSVLSERMKNIYDLFGSLPETIDDAWIDEQESLQERLDKYVHERDEARNAFTLTYDDRLDPEADQWEECSRVLSRRDIEEEMDKGW